MGFDKLRDYQIADAKFLAQLDACACFNEQRTGKTPTALYACELKQRKKILIVCPASTIFPWVDAVKFWTGKSAIAYVGTREQRKALLSKWDYALIASYDTVKQLDEGKKKEIYQLINCKPDAIIVDEAHRIGHHNIDRSKALFAVGTRIPYRMVLTGSPAIGMSKDVWGILHFLYPSTFSSYWRFIEQFYHNYSMFGIGAREYREVGDIYPHMIPVLQGILQRISTQRKRKDVMAWLPEKDRQLVRLPLTDRQRKHLKELEEVWETEQVITQGTLDRLMRYRQICLDPILLGFAENSPKTAWVLQYLKDYPDVPTLIFSKFTKYLSHVQSLTKLPIIFGDTSLRKRNEICADFQAGKTNALLLNIDACKEGLTLDRAEAIIFTDKYPPIGDIEQAEDRFVATTMARANKPHVIYELVMEDSYDEDIVQMLLQRKDETSIVNDYKTKHERMRKKNDPSSTQTYSS